MILRWRYLAIVAVAAIILGAFLALGILSPSGGPQPTSTTGTLQSQMGMLITSSAFKDGERIPSKYTCDGYGISPPVIWNGVPAGTLTLALIVEDVDAPAGVFTHWVIFNISSSTSGLQEGNPSFPLELPSGAIQGKNSLGNVGYVGPCPPSGTHRYVFHLYALDTQLNLPSEATRQDLLNAMQGHVLAEGQLTGLYSRS